MQPITQASLDPKLNDIRHLRAEQEFCGVIGCFGLITPKTLGQPVCRTANALTAAIQNVRVNHGRTNVTVPQKFLNGSNVIAIREQMGSKRMPECMAGYPFGQSCLPHCQSHGSLHQRFVHVMATLFICPWVAPTIFLREYILPPPLTVGVRVLAGQSVWQIDSTIAFFDVFTVN